MFRDVRGWVREVQLAGDGRAGSWARTKARRRQWQFIRRQWRFFAVTMVCAAAITSLVLAFVHTEFLRGLIVGTSVAGTLSALAMLVMLVTGTAPISMGATAEQWTASELRPLKRAGWRVMNHVALRAWDIDHVLVGPGGVIAVETKWSSYGWELDPPDAALARAVDQARANARSLRLWQGIRSLGIESVSPVVFLWGNNQDDPQTTPSTPRRVGDVTVIHGVHAARVWRKSVESNTRAHAHDSDQVQNLWNALDEHIRGRDTYDRATSSPAAANPDSDLLERLQCHSRGHRLTDRCAPNPAPGFMVGLVDHRPRIRRSGDLRPTCQSAATACAWLARRTRSSGPLGRGS